MTTLADDLRALLGSIGGTRAELLVWNLAGTPAMKTLENDGLLEREGLRFALSEAGRSALAEERR
jgi:hypothetical protein